MLELLVAIALMDVIALTLYSSMYIGFRTKKNCQEFLEPYQRVNPAFEIIKEDFFNAMQPDGILAGVFVGEDIPWENRQDSDTLSFFTDGYDPDEEELASNVINVQYALETDQIRKQVILQRWTTKNLLSPNAIEGTPEVICRGLAGFDVEYFDGTSWLESWDSTENENLLPRGVRVTLTIFEEKPVRSSRMDVYEPYRDFSRTFMLSPTTQQATAEEETEEEETQEQAGMQNNR